MKTNHVPAGIKLIAVGATVATLAACGSSNSPKASITPSTSPSPTASTTGPADPAVTAAVTRAYETFFSGNKHPAQALAALQNGDKLVSVLAQSAKNPMSGSITATVSKVVLANPHLALVTFTLLEKGTPLLPNNVGKAVLVGGTWKVAAITFCGLQAATQGNKVPAACTPGVMALPTS